MSWASTRETSREEDMSYCLLGIFSVHMPLLYGEGGENAFMRLQEEIMKESTDHSLFAWRRVPPSEDSGVSGGPASWGVLATHPSQFKHGVIRNVKTWRSPYSMTSRGLRIQLPVLVWARRTFALLECGLDGWDNEYLGIQVTQAGVEFEDGELFMRSLDWNVYQVSREQVANAPIRTIYLFKRDFYPIMKLPEPTELSRDDDIEQTLHDLSIFPHLSEADFPE